MLFFSWAGFESYQNQFNKDAQHTESQKQHNHIDFHGTVKYDEVELVHKVVVKRLDPATAVEYQVDLDQRVQNDGTREVFLAVEKLFEFACHVEADCNVESALYRQKRNDCGLKCWSFLREGRRFKQPEFVAREVSFVKLDHPHAKEHEHEGKGEINCQRNYELWIEEGEVGHGFFY